MKVFLSQLLAKVLAPHRRYRTSSCPLLQEISLSNSICGGSTFHRSLRIIEFHWGHPQMSNVWSDNQERLSKGSANLLFAQHFFKMFSALNFVLLRMLIDGTTSLTTHSKFYAIYRLAVLYTTYVTFWDSCCERSKISFGKEQKQDRNQHQIQNPQSKFEFRLC